MQIPTELLAHKLPVLLCKNCVKFRSRLKECSWKKNKRNATDRACSDIEIIKKR